MRARKQRLGTAAYIGLDAFSVPMQMPGGNKVPSCRMMCVGVPYPPGKEHSRHLADFDLASCR